MAESEEAASREQVAGSRLVAAWLRVGGPAEAGEGALEASAPLAELLVAQRGKAMGAQPTPE